MSKINYAAMSDQQLKKYFLEHRDNETALQEYLFRRRQRIKSVITTVDDSDFDVKVQESIRQQINKSIES